MEKVRMSIEWLAMLCVPGKELVPLAGKAIEVGSRREGSWRLCALVTFEYFQCPGHFTALSEV
jgi:hypothetical protein